MKTVGLRELKNHLSEYVRRVRAGESVRVTDRGQVVAHLLPPNTGVVGEALPAGLLGLAARGDVALAREKSRPLPRMPQVKLKRSVAQMLDDARGNR